MKKNKYDLFLIQKKLRKNKLLNNLSTLHDEKKRLHFIKKTLNEMINQNQINESDEVKGSDLKINASFKQNIMNKIQVSRNRENHVEQEISNNLAEVGKVEKQKEKILEKKRFNEIQKENFLELKKENFFKPKNSFSL